MGIWISHLHGQGTVKNCNWWNWRPTVEIIRASHILDDERCDNLDLGFGELTIKECRQIAAYIRKEFVVKLSLPQRVQLDLTITDKPNEDGKPFLDEINWHKNYSTSLSWLQEFTSLLEETQSGLYIAQ